MTAELLLEIGTEEIPAGYLEKGLAQLKSLAQACMEENRIDVTGRFLTFGTPRRLVLIGESLSLNQRELVKEVMGPPVAVAYDENGRPTKATIGFAKKQGVPVEKLESIETPKGEYLYVRQNFPGRPTIDILAEALPGLISGIKWPKSMRWGSVGFAFVRPIHWIIAVLGGKVVPFEVAGIKAGRSTTGHRFMSPEFMEVSDVRDYLEKMKKGFVLIDQSEREKTVERLCREAARDAGGEPAQDGNLLATVANLVEYPSVVCGHFDQSFLELPEDVLITAMKEHQKYFSVYDSEGCLMPNFLAINNTVARDETVTRRGHERVLRARLSDAAFFFKEDLKIPLGDRIDQLKRVIYQAELGTSHAKVLRFTKLAEYLGERLLPERLDDLRIVAGLCKCDLVTQMVTEFPSLQGIMGREYARLEGKPEEICLAIHEHYLPLRSGGELPKSELGAIIGCADRMDTVAGCFAIGFEPSGRADPFALRRHAIAIIRILQERQWDLSLNEFIRESLSILSLDIHFEREPIFNKILNFFRERYKQMMLSSGYASDIVEAVISVGFDEINKLRTRLEQVNRFVTESPEFHELALTFKRVTNILKNQERSYKVETNLFRDASETDLWDVFVSLKEGVEECIEQEDYYGAMSRMVRLRRPVDDFFDNVEILTKDDKALRENRIGLLQQLSRFFLGVADFARFSV